MKKTFCLDTNIFLYDPDAIYSFEDNDIIIPLVVLEEIDRQKDRHDDAGKNARLTNRVLDTLRKQGDLSKGVKLPGGGTVKIAKSRYNMLSMPIELDKEKTDNIIIAMVKDLEEDQKGPVILITKDISMRIKCDMLGVKCDDYLKHHVIDGDDLVYGGIRIIETTTENVNAYFTNKGIKADKVDPDKHMLPNEFVVLKNGSSQSGLCRLKKDRLVPISASKDIWGLRTRNKEQQFAMDILLDKNVKFVSMIGPAGTGKTLLATAAGLHQVLEDKLYSKLIVTRPIQPMGRDIGYLPGTKEEKMEPWVQPIVDNLEYLFRKSQKADLDMYFDSGIIEIEAITYIRGRSIPNTFMIIDEAQNLTPDEVKTIITRVGEGSKIVLTGDIEQIDNGLIDSISNGLTYAVEKFKRYDIAGHITMIKGERSDLATLAADIL